MRASHQRRRAYILCRRRSMKCRCLCHKEVEKTHRALRLRLLVEILRAGRIIWPLRYQIVRQIITFGHTAAALFHDAAHQVGVWTSSIAHQLGDMAHTIHHWLELINKLLA